MVLAAKATLEAGIIKMHTRFESIVSTVSTVRSSGSTHHPTPPIANGSDDGCVELAVPHQTKNASVATNDDADGADANAAVSANLSPLAVPTSRLTRQRSLRPAWPMGKAKNSEKVSQCPWYGPGGPPRRFSGPLSG